MRKIIVPIIGFFIIIGIYFVTHKKEQTQQEIKQQQLKQQQLLSKKQQQQKELNNLELLITQAYNNKNLDKLKSFQDMLLKFKVSDKYDLVSNELNTLISKTDDYISKTQKYLKNASLQQHKNICLKQLNNLKSNISNLTNNDLRKLKITLPNDKCYQYIRDEINNFITQINQTIKDRNQKYYQTKREECLKKLNSYTAYLDGSSVLELQNIKYKIKNLAQSKCNDYISNEINRAIFQIDHKVKNIAYQKEKFKDYCINQYNYLRKEYRDAKSLWGDDDDKISDVQTGAIKLKNKGCDKYLGDSLDKLIKKCNNDL